MVGQQVRFQTAAFSHASDDSTHNISHDSSCLTSNDSPGGAIHKMDSRLAWWKGYVPLESWTPPVKITRFKDLVGIEPRWKFKRYKLAEELRSIPEWTDDPKLNLDIRKQYILAGLSLVTDPSTTEYDRWFNGDFDEVTETLAYMQLLELRRGRNVGVQIRSRLHRQIDLITSPPRNVAEAVDTAISMDPYDCGWDASSDHDDDSVPIACQRMQSDPYDCGWDDADLDRNEPCGLEGGIDSHPEPATSEDLYDCGWEDGMEILDALPDREESAHNRPLVSQAESGVSQGDPYDCGWVDEEQAVMDGPHRTGSVYDEKGISDDPYDCGWDDEEQAAEDDPYDCGWEQPMNIDDISAPAPQQDGSTDPILNQPSVRKQDVIDLTSSLSSSTSNDSYKWGLHAGHHAALNEGVVKSPEVIDLTSPLASRYSTPRRASGPQALGNAKHSTGDSSLPLRSVADNQRNTLIRSLVAPNAQPMPGRIPALRYGVYGAIQDQIAEFGEDVVELYQLLDIHRRILGPLDAMITNIEGGGGGESSQ
ncbi:hypothetical protein BDR07DRAFT_1494622 [Suillus spraguei]|nr:hypothetical protein BDR07DRAFT_1494622 [Suillus spraguei]